MPSASSVSSKVNVIYSKILSNYYPLVLLMQFCISYAVIPINIIKNLLSGLCISFIKSVYPFSNSLLSSISFNCEIAIGIMV